MGPDRMLTGYLCVYVEWHKCMLGMCHPIWQILRKNKRNLMFEIENHNFPTFQHIKGILEN